MKYRFLSTTRKRNILYQLHPTKRCWFLVPGGCLLLLLTFLLFICSNIGPMSGSCGGDGQCYCATFFKMPKAATTVQSRKVDSPLPVENKTSFNDTLKMKIWNENLLQYVWNLEQFGHITNNTIIIVVQAHKRKEYLQELIKSFENTKYIEETLLVFSHSFFSDEINDIVRSIKFTRVIQIFFPYGLQTHPNTFPGFSPNDCPHGISKQEAEARKCFGKARDVTSLQVKHHWWWKINAIFNHLRITQDFNGLVFFLEEDHYVFPDLLHMLKLMRELAPEKCPDCNIFGLGQNPRHRSVNDYKGVSNKVSVVQWNNMGFAFDRKFWEGLGSKACSDMFCDYNDYNWDFTLAYLSHRCLPQEIKPLTVVSPRVFHIGDCGVHFHNANCTALKALEETRNLQASVAQYLFPPHVTVVSTNQKQYKVDGRNGGWDDPRDVNLCKAMTRQINE